MAGTAPNVAWAPVGPLRPTRPAALEDEVVSCRRRPRFAHGLELTLGAAGSFRVGQVVLCRYHPSQRNVLTGRLSPAMLDAVLSRAFARHEAGRQGGTGRGEVGSP